MKIKMLFVALALMAMASVSFGQFNAVLYTTDTFTTGCDGGDMLPDGSPVVSIYWDANNNGPDAADVLAPDAVQNTYSLNGEEYLGIPGAFYTDPAFTYNSFTPAVSKFYVVVDAPSARYTSSVVTIPPAFSQWDLTGLFTCQVTAVPCDEPTNVFINTVGGRNFLANGPYYQCVRACANTTVEICLGPLAADEYPHALVLPGCLSNGCQIDCPPAQFGFSPTGWTYNAANGTWCNIVVVATEGCFCFCLEFIEGAVDVSLTAEAGDASVNVAWSVAAENNMARYDVQRRVFGHEFETIGSVVANNTNTSSSYTFVDESANNGTIYEYTLNLVDLNGTVTALGTIASATPSVDAAVVTEYALHQNYPNPFNPSTNLVFDVVAENVVNLTVYNAMGQEVASLVNGTMAAGRHTVSFDAANLTSGLYFYTVKIGNEFTATKKMLLVK